MRYFILATFLCVALTNQAGASSRAPRFVDIDCYINNNTSTTFTIRMRNTATSAQYMFYGVPGGTVFGTVPEGSYDVHLYPNSGAYQYNFSGFCSFSGIGYAISWYNVPGSYAHACSYVMNVNYY